MRCIVILALVAGTGAAEQLKEELTDAAISARVDSMFVINKYLSPLNINTRTSDGVVTLTGSVDDEVQKKMAEDLAASLKGVKSVINNLTVVGTIENNEKRSFRQKLLDKKINTAVRSRLLLNREFKGLQIGVSTMNNVVTLYGVVRDEYQKARIGQIASRGEDVHSVINNLTVQPSDTGGAIKQLGQDFSDEWVESLVETAVLLNRHISIRALDVEVNDGVCILTGTVDTQAQRTLAENIANSIRGVDKVRNDIHLREEDTEDRPLQELKEIDLAPPATVP